MGQMERGDRSEARRHAALHANVSGADGFHARRHAECLDAGIPAGVRAADEPRNPLPMLSDSPSNYLREPEMMEFLGPVPSVWDDTKVLDGKIAEYVLVARKSGNDWYVGAMTDWTPRDLEIDFSFLPDGN